MRVLGKILLYFFTGVFSFLLFLYLTFPYQVLKERIAGAISKESGSLVSIKTLDPSFPLGLSFSDVKVYKPGIEDLKIARLSAQVSFVNLLFGGLKVFVQVEDLSGGQLDIETKLRLASVISDPESIFPSSVSIQSENFDFSSIVNYIIRLQSGSKDMNPMVKSALRDVMLVGKLKSNSYFEFDQGDYLNSKGQLDLELQNSGLELLSLPFQEFTQAKIKATLDKGLFDFSPETKFVSDGLKFELSGGIKQSEDLMASKPDLLIKVELFNALKDNFGMILDMASGSSAEGSMKIKVKGSLNNPKVDIF